MAKLLASARKLGSPLAVRARKIRSSRPLTYRDTIPIVVNGRQLNKPETVIYYALSELRVEFIPQFAGLGGDVIGGYRLDFYLPRQLIDFEYEGPWHFTQFGKARDTLRDLGAKSKLGVRRVRLYETDLPNIKKVLLYHIGRLV